MLDQDKKEITVEEMVEEIKKSFDGFGAALDVFRKAYIETMFWSSTDDDDEPLDYDYTSKDIATRSMSSINKDCAQFMILTWGIIRSDLKRAGHDFWLTRQHHGPGFWDGDWGQYGDILTEVAHLFPEQYPYVSMGVVIIK
jgi:hypothetical protein